MGVQLSIDKKVMRSAGWTSKDVEIQAGYWDTTQADNYGEAPEWVPPMVVRVWEHPKQGTISAYAVHSGGFFIDCNSWGDNRHVCEAAGLFELPHYLG